MTQHIKHDLRLSETVSPFGTGAIVDVLGASLIAPDTSYWNPRLSTEIHCARLSDRIRNCKLVEAPTYAGRADKNTEGLRYWRFPAWRFCEQCTKLSSATTVEKGKMSNTCIACKGSLVPMRYVAACEGGSHIQDVPWFMWAHRGRGDDLSEEIRHCRAYKELRFVRSSSHGEGLSSLRVACNACKRSRPLSDLLGKDSLTRDGIRCGGRQPWEDQSSASICEHKLVAVQRGATSNYIADVISALDIPEEAPASISLGERIREHPDFQRLLDNNGTSRAELIAGFIAEDLDVTADEVLTVLGAGDADDSKPLGDDSLSIQADLTAGEWAAFVKKLDFPGQGTSSPDFIVDAHSAKSSTSLGILFEESISHIGQVRRIREVRALRAFQRRSLEATRIRAGIPSSGRRIVSYPAIEVFGEGIFLRFDEARLQDWEAESAVRARSRILGDRFAGSDKADRFTPPEPRFIALHTLAHLLIRRLAYSSGYPAASLRERVYADTSGPDHTAGILIYTASGDAQGTLGGLVRLGDPEKLFPLLVAALDDADYCSNDPVCIESDRHRLGSLNLAACHGCALISETSCERMNSFLDRQMLLGADGLPGLFEDVLKQVRSTIQAN